jgi:hypothetical protein
MAQSFATMETGGSTAAAGMQQQQQQQQMGMFGMGSMQSYVSSAYTIDAQQQQMRVVGYEPKYEYVDVPVQVV